MDALMNELKNRITSSDPSSPNYRNTYRQSAIADYLKSEREMSIFVLVAKRNNDGTYTYTELTSKDVISYSINEQSGDDGFNIGSTISASYTLIIDNTTSKYTSSDFVNTRIAAAIGIKIDGRRGIHYEPFGVWSVTDVNASEQSTTIDINGLDALATEYNGKEILFKDAVYLDGTISYAKDVDLDGDWHLWGSAFPLNCFNMAEYIAAIVLKRYYVQYRDDTQDWWAAFSPVNTTPYDYRNVDIAHYLPAYMEFDSIDTWWNVYDFTEATERTFLGWAASIQGCFARMSRDGAFEFQSYDKDYSKYTPTQIDHSLYYSLVPKGLGSFNFSKYIVNHFDGFDTSTVLTDEYGEDQVDESTNSFVIRTEENPLWIYNYPPYIYNLFHTNEFSSEAIELTFCGAPQLQLGDQCNVVDMSGVTHRIIINSMTTTFDGGLSMTIACNLQSDAALYTTSTSGSSTLLGNVKSSTIKRRPYSLEEVATGNKWIDGKPLYRKVIQITTKDTIDISDLDFDFIRWEFAYKFTWASGTTIQWSSTYYYNSNDYAMVYVNGTNLIIRMVNNIHLIDGYIILEYTKQTSN